MADYDWAEALKNHPDELLFRVGQGPIEVGREAFNKAMTEWVIDQIDTEHNERT